MRGAGRRWTLTAAARRAAPLLGLAVAVDAERRRQRGWRLEPAPASGGRAVMYGPPPGGAGDAARRRGDGA